MYYLKEDLVLLLVQDWMSLNIFVANENKINDGFNIFNSLNIFTAKHMELESSICSYQLWLSVEIHFWLLIHRNENECTKCFHWIQLIRELDCRTTLSLFGWHLKYCHPESPANPRHNLNGTQDWRQEIPEKPFVLDWTE